MSAPTAWTISAAHQKKKMVMKKKGMMIMKKKKNKTSLHPLIFTESLVHGRPSLGDQLWATVYSKYMRELLITDILL